MGILVKVIQSLKDLKPERDGLARHEKLKKYGIKFVFAGTQKMIHQNYIQLCNFQTWRRSSFKE